MKFIIPVGVAVSTFGCALSSQFAAARLCYVAARQGHMLEAFSYIHVKRLTPAPAVVLQVSDAVSIYQTVCAVMLCLS
jgi:L-type amino acid transporter 9